MKKFPYILAFVILSAGAVYYASLSPRYGAEIPKELKLKVGKDKILDSRDVDDIVCTNKFDVKTCVNKGKIKEYAYISDVEVPQDSIVINGKSVQEDMDKRTENSQHFKIKETSTGEVYQAKIFLGQPFIKENDKWMQIETATTTIKSYNEQTKISFIGNLVALATDYYPGSNSNNSIFVGGGTDWAAQRNATSGTLRTYAGNVMDVVSYYVSSYVFIDRTFMNFDTSGIPDDATVSSGSVNVKVVSSTKDNSPDYRLYNSTASDPLVDGDFDQFGTTELSDTYITTPTVGSYNVYTLNTAGKSAVSLTGLTKFCIREFTYDYGNVRPTGSNIMEMSNANPAGTASDPYLTITYSTGGGGTPLPIPNDDIIYFE